MKRSESPTDLAHVLGDAAIGVEARALRDDHLALKVWLRLLASSTQIETMIRKRLRTRFGMSLARFDYLAQLHRHRDGIRMNALSRYLMVTGGNVTGLTDELEKEGFVTRASDPSDRRSFIVKLTRDGRRSFERIAAEHEQWVIELFEGVPAADLQRLYDTLGRLRLALNESANPTTDGPAP